MNIWLDEMLYKIDVEKITMHLKYLYVKINEQGDKIILKNGKTIHFGKKSLLRTGLSQCISTFLVPIMRDMYESKKLQPPVYVRHSDMIEYFLNGVLDFFSLLSQNGNLYVTSIEDTSSNIRNIISISTVRPNNNNKETAQETSETKIPGRTTLVCSGQNGNGQNSFNQENYQEEIRNSTIP